MPDALISEKLGSAETYSIPTNAKPDGNATRPQENARKTNQAQAWEVKPLVSNTAPKTQTRTDAILQTTNVKNAKKMLKKDAREIRRKLVTTVKLQQQVNGNVTELIKIIQNVTSVRMGRTILIAVLIQYVTTALLHRTFRNVIIRLLNAQRIQED